VKKVKIDFLNSQCDSFHMLDSESIDELHTRLIIITNGHISLGKASDND